MSVKDLLKPLGSKGYKSPADEGPILPYDRAAGVWDNLIGTSRQAAYNWCRAFFVAMLAVIALIGGLIYQNSRITLVPYIIQVDNATGMAVPVGTVKDGVRPPNEKEIQYFLSQFVQNTRSCTMDPVVNKKNWSLAYKFMLPSAAAKMDAVIAKEKPFDRFGQETVEVKTHVVVPLSKKSYQIRWTENVYSSDGRLKSSTRMTGLFTVELGKAQSENELRINPLSIFVKDFSWNQEV